jgi:preprotein translocase subunit SecD
VAISTRTRFLRLVVGVCAGVILLGSAGYGGSSQAKASAGSGLEIVLRAADKASDSELDRSVTIMQNRLAGVGGGGSVTRQAGSKLVVVRLDHAALTRGGAEIVDKTAQLDFYDLTPSLLPPSIDASENVVAETSLYDLLSPAQSSSQGTPGPYYLFRTTGKKLVAGPEPTRGQLLKSYGGKIPEGAQVLAVPERAVVVTCDSAVTRDCPDGTTGVRPAAGVTYYYLLKHGSYAHAASGPYPQLTDADLKLSQTQQELDPTTGQPIVTIQFSRRGDKKFLAITKAEAQRGAALGVPQSFAIVLDNQLYSFPTIDYSMFPAGIDPTAGGAEITGLTSLSEAKHIVLVLQSGALPVNFVVVSRTATG